jgi:hypothetical protein
MDGKEGRNSGKLGDFKKKTVLKKVLSRKKEDKKIF